MESRFQLSAAYTVGRYRFHLAPADSFCLLLADLYEMVTAGFSLNLIFTALHGMQTRYCDENSVRPSVRLSAHPSVCHTREL